jgi:hypothetical protein
MEHRVEIVSAKRLNELGAIILIGNHFASYGASAWASSAGQPADRPNGCSNTAAPRGRRPHRHEEWPPAPLGAVGKLAKLTVEENRKTAPLGSARSSALWTSPPANLAVTA